MIRFRVFGRVGLERTDGPIGPAAEQRKPLALLTLLTMARSRGLTREKLVAFLWPDATEENSRNTLKQTLYSLRRDLGVDDLIVTGPAQALVINPAVASADVWTFEDAIDRGALDEAVDAYTGPFLDGFFLRGCAEFEQWAERERARLAALYAEALNQLAQAATQRGDHTQAVQWWRRLAVVAPLDSRVALRYMEALVASGDRSAAIVHASVHHALLRDELGAAADPAIAAFADRLRNGSEPSLRRSPTSTPMVVDEISQSGPQEDVFAPPPAVPEHAALQPKRRWHVALAGLLPLVLVIAFVVASLSSSSASSGTVQRDVEMVAIAPFQLVAPDTSLSYLREGMVDLLAAKIGGVGSVNAVTPSAIVSPWSKQRAENGSDPSREDAIAIARAARATKLVVGSVIVSSDRVALQASLLDVERNGETIADASAEGRIGDVPRLIDRLSAELLSTLLGGDATRAPTFGATPLVAVRAYAVGRSAFRAGDYQAALTSFQHAIDLDSTFALAALDLSRAAGWLGDQSERHRGRRLAWAHRDRLSPADLALLVAIVGPRYPAASTARERIVAWERVTELLSGQPDSWFELGDQLFHTADLIGDSLARMRIPLAFARAIERDSAFGPSLEHAVQYAARVGDTATVRVYAARAVAAQAASGQADFVTWRVGLSLPDWASRSDDVRRRFDSIDPRSLRSIALSSMFDQIAIADGSRALESIERRAVQSGDQIDALLGLHAVSLMRGSRTRADSVLARLSSTPGGEQEGLHLRVLDAILAGGDRSLARAAADRLVGKPSEVIAPIDAVADACAVGQWWLFTGDIKRAHDAVATLERLKTARDPDDNIAKRIASEAEICLLLLRSWEKVETKSKDALPALITADSLIAQGPNMNTRLEAQLPLALAPLWEKMGRPREALHAVRRVGYFFRWPHYRAEELRTEGRLAESLGAKGDAIAAYTRYLTLRDAPDSNVLPEVNDVRAALARLREPP